MLETTTMRSRANEFKQSSAAGYLAVIFATACWGTSGIFVKFIFASIEMSALALAFWRDLTTFIVLLVGIGILRPKLLRIRRADLGWLIALGGGLGIFHVFWNLAVLLNGAAVATVQQAAMPAIVAIIAWIVWRESLTWNKILAIVLTFVGTVLVSGIEKLGAVEMTMAGFLVGLALPIAYSGYNLFGKMVRQQYHYSSLTILVYAFGFGALALFPFQFFTAQPWPLATPGVLWFAGMIGLATIIPWASYTFALGKLPASVAGILAMTEIPIVAVYAYVLLREQMTPIQLVGAVLVIIGVLLLSWSRRQNGMVPKQHP